jgi:cell division septum initiation protein DivIVA
VQEGLPIQVDQLFTQLEDLILGCPRVPLTSKIIMDEDRLLDLLDHLRQELPVELRHAQEVLAQRDALIQEAQREADATKGLAERQRQVMVTDTEIYRLGQMEAERLVREAERQIQAQQDSADIYAEEVLGELENKIARALQTIKNGRQYLTAPRA